MMGNGYFLVFSSADKLPDGRKKLELAAADLESVTLRKVYRHPLDLTTFRCRALNGHGHEKYG